MPISTTHAISTSIVGVGCAKRFGTLNLPIVTRTLIAWMLTLPITTALSYAITRIWLGK